MKKIVLFLLVLVLSCLSFSACRCNHEFDAGSITTPATCTSEGVKTYTCTLCGETKTEAIPQLSHSYDSGRITTEASCTSEGEKTFTCTLCGNTRTESVDKKEHSYVSHITKEPTFTEEGVLTFTCSACGATYTEAIPVRDDEVVVTVTDKTNIPKNTDEWRYSDRVEFTFLLENMTDKPIRGIQGTLTVKDLFGKEILVINCDFTGNTIPGKGSITIDGLGIDINQFLDSHTKLYNEKYSDLIFEYEVSNIVYGGETSVDSGDTSVNSSPKVIVNVTDKRNLEIDYNVYRYSPRVEFTFVVVNNTDKDIKGIEGTLHIKDLFGKEFLLVSCDFTGNTIPTHGSVTIDGLGVDINRFIDEDVKLYSEDYSDLIFEYEITTIVYTDGSSESSK